MIAVADSSTRWELHWESDIFVNFIHCYILESKTDSEKNARSFFDSCEIHNDVLNNSATPTVCQILTALQVAIPPIFTTPLVG